MYLDGGKRGFSYPVVWIWVFFHLPSFLHSGAPGNMSDLPNLGLSDHIQTHSYQLRYITQFKNVDEYFKKTQH